MRFFYFDTLMRNIILIVWGFVAGYFCVLWIQKIAVKRQWVSPPRPDRWHTRPVALYGGIGILAAWAPLSLWLIVDTSKVSPTPLIPSLFAGCVFMFALGLLDDVYHLSPVRKLMGQLVATSVLIAQGLVLNVFPWYSANVFLTYIWFVGIINAVNMLDNMDGLAAGVVGIGCFSLWLIFTLEGGGDHIAIQLLSILIGVLAGFLAHNFSPASIFMGDSGSLFIGFFLAVISVPSAINHHWFTNTSTTESQLLRSLVLLGPALVLTVPIFDTTLVTLARKWHGRNARVGGKDHSSHRLVGLGLSEVQSVIILYGLAATGGSIAVFSHFYQGMSIYLFLCFLALLSVFGIYLGRFRVYKEEPRPPRWTPLVTNLFHKRRFLEIIMDIIFIIVAYHFSFWIIFEGEPKSYTAFFRETLPYISILTVLIFWAFGFYRDLWHLIGIGDLSRYFGGILLSSALLAALIKLNGWGGFFLFSLLEQHRVGIPFFFALILSSLIIGSRISFRYLDNMLSRQKSRKNQFKIVIYGAGHGGKIIMEELKSNPAYQSQYEAICFIDDDIQKHKRFLGGIPIMHSGAFHNFESVDEIWISTVKIDPADLLKRLHPHLKQKVPILKRFSLSVARIN